MSWLADAVIYEIYPQSFADSNGDGIGDLPGVIDHLDHLAWLGVDAIWFNPCFASPFVDAGYDVSDYLRDRAALRHATTTWSRSSRRRASAASGCCSTSSPGTPRSSTRGSRPSPAATARARRRPLRLAEPLPARRQRPPVSRWVASPGPAPGLVPQELLRRAARAELRLRPAPTPTSRGAQPSTRPARGATARRCGRSSASGSTAGVAGFRVDMAFSLVKDDPDRRGDGRAVARDARAGCDAPTPTPC